jgi:hypothetical protein
MRIEIGQVIRIPATGGEIICSIRHCPGLLQIYAQISVDVPIRQRDRGERIICRCEHLIVSKPQRELTNRSTGVLSRGDYDKITAMLGIYWVGYASTSAYKSPNLSYAEEIVGDCMELRVEKASLVNLSAWHGA